MVCSSYGFHSRSVYCVNPLARSVESLLDLHARGPGIETEAEAISGSVAVEDNSFFEGGHCGRIMYTVYIAFLLALACGLTLYLYL